MSNVLATHTHIHTHTNTYNHTHTHNPHLRFEAEAKISEGTGTSFRLLDKLNKKTSSKRLTDVDLGAGVMPLRLKYTEGRK